MTSHSLSPTSPVFTDAQHTQSINTQSINTQSINTKSTTWTGVSASGRIRYRVVPRRDSAPAQAALSSSIPVVAAGMLANPKIQVTRRRFLFLAGATALTVPTLGANCDPALLMLAIQVAKFAFAVAEEVAGNVDFRNDSSEEIAVEIILAIINELGEVISEDSIVPSIPNGEHSVEWSGLTTEETGSHTAQAQALGDSKEVTFDVV